MAKTTNILDLNNRLTKVEKEKVAQNSYTSLKNKPKINGHILTGDKSSSDLGLAAASDIADTGWIQIDTSGIFYRKCGNIVAIRGETVADTTSWTLLATLPQGYRPVDTFMRALRAVPQDDKLSSLYVNSDGAIYAESEVTTKFHEIFFVQ